MLELLKRRDGGGAYTYTARTATTNSIVGQDDTGDNKQLHFSMSRIS